MLFFFINVKVIMHMTLYCCNEGVLYLVLCVIKLTSLPFFLLFNVAKIYGGIKMKKIILLGNLQPEGHIIMK